MSKANILVVENNPITAKALRNDLKNGGGYKALVANCADSALEYIKKHSFDLLITDIDLNDSHTNGIDITKKLNKTKDTPVIFLTAQGDDELLENISMIDRSYYLSKPYKIDELLKIIKLMLYKYNPSSIKKVHLNDNTTFDINNKLLHQDDKEIKLTTKESLFVTLLSNQKNQIVSYDEIVEFVWENQPVSQTTMRQLASRVREKLSPISIETHHNLGYRLKI